MWAIMTYLLEGRILTLQRPDAVIDRIIYTIIAIFLIGTLIGMFAVRTFVKLGEFQIDEVSNNNYKRTIITITIAFSLGMTLYIIQNPPTLDPIVILNGFCQVLTVSIAEIVVCWVLLGNAIKNSTAEYSKYISITIATLISSLAFGFYHFAHSPPFNTIQMVFFLTIIGIGTSVFYFITKNIYATVIFHNFMGTLGVLNGLKAAGNLGAYSEPLVPIYITALISILILIGLDYLVQRAALVKIEISREEKSSKEITPIIPPN
ncbi:MAG: hypothetical protein GF383_04645 [Candidatus Lokiarchaeota archaeon]|nr:hypothetical protein [Candidatus Lokiarchaeota archaeon]MBD3339074.1 hypothetical protein [Candidatus Lokiarchaeota archaeon]